eukprot:m.482235 g.482235  ORF g.482235 m.482235 type:complete len:98 (-) comp21721_c1_seq23:1837-2130(-)
MEIPRLCHRRDPFAVLQLETYDAPTDDGIRMAVHALARELHPDVRGRRADEYRLLESDSTLHADTRSRRMLAKCRDGSVEAARDRDTSWIGGDLSDP